MIAKLQESNRYRQLQEGIGTRQKKSFKKDMSIKFMKKITRPSNQEFTLNCMVK